MGFIEEVDLDILKEREAQMLTNKEIIDEIADIGHPQVLSNAEIQEMKKKALDRAWKFIDEEMPQSDRCELWGSLIDVVEDWLESKGITQSDIPNDDREECGYGAIIFGDDYDYLADRFAEVIGIARDNMRELKGE